jgi:LmbE family N-acetylglucosaminyl deacetylase
MNNKNVILVIAAHPDDEILGCGGTIARYSREGHLVHILIMAEGITSRDEKRNRDSRIDLINHLHSIALRAGFFVGAKSVELLEFPDNRMDSCDQLEIIKAIEKKIKNLKPTIIFTHFSNDLNIDHRIINTAVITACRPLSDQSVRELYFFEIPSSTEWNFGNSSNNFLPNFFVTLTEEDFLRKIGALEIYKSEMREFPHPRSIPAIDAISKWRGATVGVDYAESFCIGRIIR